MKSFFFLLTAASVLLTACERQATVAEREQSAELEQLRQKQQTADEKIREFEGQELARLQEKTVQLAQDAQDAQQAETRSREELGKLKQENEQAAGRIQELEAQASKSAPAASIAEAPRDTAVRADLERVVEEEDREPVYTGRVVPETQHVTSVQTFYEPLDPYGDWIETGDYGYVFRPQVAGTSTNWRPYTDGRWVHSDYGWTWESNEDFGWATYHYGRWARVSRVGWVWVPGREWGPGWVSWRRGSDYCGWAPLPPESRTRFSFTATVDRDYDLGPAAYIFISLSNFGARSYAPICAPPERNVTIIQNTVNITNINYNTANNQTVVYNGGPSYNLVRTRSKDPVEQVNVNFAPVNKTVNNTTINKTKIVNVHQGNTLQVAAPPPIATSAAAVPSRVKERIEKPTVDKGWEGVDSAQLQKVKQQLTATSIERKHKLRPATAVTPAIPAAAPTRLERPAAVSADPVKVPPETPKTAAPRITPAPTEPSTPKAVLETPTAKPATPDRAKVAAPEAKKAEAPPAPLPRPDKPEGPKPVSPASTDATQSETPFKPKSPDMNRPGANLAPGPPPSPKRDVRSVPSSPATPAASQPRTPEAPERVRELPKVPKANRAPVDSAPPAIRQPIPNPDYPNAGANGEHNREKSVRQPAPAVQRPPHPQQPMQTPQPQSSGSDPEKKKKKKEDGQ
jgi:hypothetical protein